MLKTQMITTFITTLLMLAACEKSGTTVSALPPFNAADSAKTYLALGDSYTIGQSVPEQDRFPMQTVAMLVQQNVQIKNPVYIAATGWTTSNLMSAIASQTLKPPYDLVTLLIGVNDQYQGVDTATYRIRFTQCLNKAIELSGNNISHVIVLSIPDYSVTPYVPAGDKPRVRKQVDWFNAINKQVTLQMKVTYLDITPSSREGETNPMLIANDGLHPSGLEYKKWAMMLTPLAKQALQ